MSLALVAVWMVVGLHSPADVAPVPRLTLADYGETADAWYDLRVAPVPQPST